MSDVMSMRGTPTYSSWANLRSRCNDPKNNKYHLYGGRGIKSCKSWKSFDGFFSDMGERPSGKTIDRIDSNKGYCKDNCRWATPVEQANNKSTNHVVSHNGLSLTLAEWGRRTGIDPTTIKMRLRRGWSEKDAIEKPARIRRAFKEQS